MLMKKIFLLLALTASLTFAQRHGGFRGPMYRPPVVVRPGPVYVAPRPFFGYYGGYGFGWSPYGYWYPGFGYVYSAPEPRACQKEKLKDSEGKKHDVLLCAQSDGTMKIIDPNQSKQ